MARIRDVLAPEFHPYLLRGLSRIPHVVHQVVMAAGFLGQAAPADRPVPESTSNSERLVSIA